MKPNILPFICLLLVVMCGDPAVTKKPGMKRETYPDQESWGSRIIITREGKPVAVADSDRLVKYEDRSMANLIGHVYVDFYNVRGEHASQMVSDSADVNLETNDLSAFGSVVIKSDSGLVLHTQELLWKNDYDLISTQDTVMFTTLENDTLFGVGFESDVDLTHWKIYKPWGVTERGFGRGFK